MYYLTKQNSSVKKYFQIIILTGMFLFSQYNSSFAQQNDTYFIRHIDRQDGLAHNNVYDITQDGKGFIWIVTSAGLQRYDGNRFLFVPEMISDPSEIVTDGAILYADNKNNLIWISKSDKIEKLSSVTQFNTRRGQETLHPLVSVLDQSKSQKIHLNYFHLFFFIFFYFFYQEYFIFRYNNVE